MLAGAIAICDSQATFEGIGGERMASFGFRLWTHTRGWGGMGPIEALAKIPKLYTTMWLTAMRLRRRPVDLVVLVDFGAFNLRLAKSLRILGYRGPVLNFFPPGAWLDKPSQAQTVASVSTPLVAFEHQRDFYLSQGLPVHYFGHPLAPAYALRPPRPAPPVDGGTIAILPGSREGELRNHLPALLDAYAIVKRSRPHARAIFGAADSSAQERIVEAVAQRAVQDASIVVSANGALAQADAAWIASGTAVMEASLTGVPAIALYILSQAQARIARRVYHGEYITIPNLVLHKRVIPELLQEAATPRALASAMEALLADPQSQYTQLLDLRAALGQPDSLDRCAAFAASLARE